MALVVFDIEDLEKVMERLFGKYLQPYPLQTPENEELLQIGEAAKILNVSKSTIHSCKKLKVVPFHRVGRRVYFKRSELILSLKKIN